ncbi:MAG: universal stress protein [Pseudomonadota bacterium]|nr:universal stress protein [Pseudomonadota bacterium]
MYERILVPIDGSPTSDAGLAEAMKLAKLTGARLRLLHVVDEMPFLMSEGYGAMSADIFDLLKGAGREILEGGRARVEAADIAVDATLFDSLSGRLCERVEAEAKAWNADLVVIGTHGRRGVRRMLLGSDAEQVVRSTLLPVLLIRGTEIGASNPPAVSRAGA